MDNDTRREKQKALIAELLERKIRLHAQRIYDQRGQTEGLALQDWVQAESEVLGNSILAPLYRRTRAEGGEAGQAEAGQAEETDRSQFEGSSSQVTA